VAPGAPEVDVLPEETYLPSPLIVAGRILIHCESRRAALSLYTLFSILLI
jgi:hypothetical protein